jgi:hypothetical protein
VRNNPSLCAVIQDAILALVQSYSQRRPTIIAIGKFCPGAKEMDEGNKKRQANDLQRELNQTGLSRRAFLDRLKTLGVGFGAVSVLGVNNADALSSMDPTATVQSTNPALSTIIEEGRQDAEQFQDVAEGYGGTPGGGWGGGSGDGGYGGSGGSTYSRGGGTPYSRAYSRAYSRGYERAYTRYERAVYTRYNRVQYTRYNRVQYSRYNRVQYSRYGGGSSYSRYGGGGSGGGSGPYGGGSGGGGWGGGGGGYGGGGGR